MDTLPLPGAPLPVAPQRPAAPQVPPELRRVAEEFEAVFLGEMMAPMFEGIGTEGLGGGGLGEQIFRPMLIEQYAQSLAASGGVGIADSLARELVRLQQAATPPEAR